MMNSQSSGDLYYHSNFQQRSVMLWHAQNRSPALVWAENWKWLKETDDERVNCKFHQYFMLAIDTKVSLIAAQVIIWLHSPLTCAKKCWNKAGVKLSRSSNHSAMNNKRKAKVVCMHAGLSMLKLSQCLSCLMMPLLPCRLCAD
jgi:hypothetical protein